MSNRLQTIFGCDLRSLAVFRIALALLLLYDVADRWPHADAFYSDSGFFQREHAREESPDSFSLNYLSGSVEFQQALFVVLGVAALFLGSGLLTRTATWICWVLLVSIHVRNQFVLIGGDTLLRMLLFWSLFVPLGKTWSIDAWWRQRRQLQKETRSDALQNSQPPVLASVGTACLILQVCIMYWCAGVSKLTGPWLDGTAMEHVLRLDLYVRPFGEWTLTQPWLLALITYSTLVIELLVPFLLFSRRFNAQLRLVTILIFWGLHLGIELTLDVGNFGLVSMVSWLPLIPGCVWNRCRCCRTETELSTPTAAACQAAPGPAPEETTNGGRLGLILQTAVPLFFLVYIIVWNYYGLSVIYGKRYRPDLPESFFRLGWMTMVAQNFQMFGDPPRFNPTYVFSGRQKNGAEIDMIRDQAAEQSRPDSPDSRAVTPQWKKLHRFLLRHPGNTRFHQALLDYYTRVWNESHSADQQVIESRLECYYEMVGPEFQAGNYVRRPDLAAWKAPLTLKGQEAKTEEELIDEIDVFLKGLEQGPIR